MNCYYSVKNLSPTSQPPHVSETPSPFESKYFPEEIVFEIFNSLKRNDFISLSLVNHYFYEKTNDQLIWKKLFKKEFPCQDKLYEKFALQTPDWKQLYIRLDITRLKYQWYLYNKYKIQYKEVNKKYLNGRITQELAFEKLNDDCLELVHNCLKAQNLKPALFTACLMSDNKTLAFDDITDYLFYDINADAAIQFLINPLDFFPKEEITYCVQESIRTLKIKPIARKIVAKLLLAANPEKAEKFAAKLWIGEQGSHSWNAIGNYYLANKKIDKAEALLCGPLLKFVCLIGGYHNEFVSNLWEFYLLNGFSKKAVVLEQYVRIEDWAKCNAFEKAALYCYNAGDIDSSTYYCQRLLNLNTYRFTRHLPIIRLMHLSIKDNREGSLYEFAKLAPNPKEAIDWMMMGFCEGKSCVNFDDILVFLKTISHPDFKNQAQIKISQIRSTFCMDE